MNPERAEQMSSVTGGDDDVSNHGEMEKTMTVDICETIARNDYYGFESDGSDRQSQPHSSDPLLTKKLAQLIKAMASSDMDSKQTEAYLTSQMKRRRPRKSQDEPDADASTLTESQAAALTEFWMANRTRIHEAMMRRSDLQLPIYRSMSWTISEVVPQSSACHHHHQSSPSSAADVQIILENERKPSGADILDFEVDSTDVKRIVKVLCEIDALLLTTTSEL